MNANRLTVRLDDDAGRDVDTFEWRVFTPNELGTLGEGLGLHTLVTCTTFDETKRASADQPRMQFVLSGRSVRYGKTCSDAQFVCWKSPALGVASTTP
ncbi:MAG: hypothetical protein HY292_20995 [Planctomycetes bacterium]|nr:hypothetical protein [Planctomycetota bacterium]